MDRRYTQSRFYNGSRATSGTNARSDAYARRSLAAARAASYHAQRYGGSTGGISSIGSGQQVSIDRAIDRGDRAKTFEAFGSGALGSRGDLGLRNLGGWSASREARQFNANTSTPVDPFA